MKQIFTLFALMLTTAAMSQKIIYLYEDGKVPGSKPCDVKENSFMDTSWNKKGIYLVRDITRPSMAVYAPPKEKNKGVAVLICPGGGYYVVAAGHEGADVAQLFADNGVTAFVLRYRIPNDACMTDKSTAPLMDAQQAIWYIRMHAAEYGISPNKVGIMGFSAGGHLAATAGTHFDKAVRPEMNAYNLRPDFMMLIYPVISFREGIGHAGSREQLVGKTPDEKTLHYFSNEEQVTPKTPPAFLVHASDDAGVQPANSIVFYQSLLKNKVPAELHLYQKGGHGFGLNNTTTDDKWFDRCINWMKGNKWL